MNTVQHQTKQTAGINQPGGIKRDEVTTREQDGSGLVGVGWPQAGHCSGARYLLPCLLLLSPVECPNLLLHSLCSSDLSEKIKIVN